MVVRYYIIGGCLKVDKGVFVKEMLLKDSLLRQLMSWKTTGDFSHKHPGVSEPGQDNMISITFSNETTVETCGSPKDALGPLKQKYLGKIRGKIYCRSNYELFGGVSFFSIDLDSDGNELIYQ